MGELASLKRHEQSAADNCNYNGHLFLYINSYIFEIKYVSVSYDEL